MKLLRTITMVACFSAISGMLLAQTPQQTPPAARGGRGGGRGMMPQVPPPPQPLMDVANKIADAINKQDAAALNKMVTPETVYLDEDGHAPPIARWVTNLTSGNKKIEISNPHGQIIDGGGWLSFNFALTETFQGNPKTLKGTATFALKQTGGDWTIQMVHGSFFQKVAGITDGN